VRSGRFRNRGEGLAHFLARLNRIVGKRPIGANHTTYFTTFPLHGGPTRTPQPCIHHDLEVTQGADAVPPFRPGCRPISSRNETQTVSPITCPTIVWTSVENSESVTAVPLPVEPPRIANTFVFNPVCRGIHCLDTLPLSICRNMNRAISINCPSSEKEYLC